LEKDTRNMQSNPSHTQGSDGHQSESTIYFHHTTNSLYSSE